jgi:hypothetical protein
LVVVVSEAEHTSATTKVGSRSSFDSCFASEGAVIYRSRRTELIGQIGSG